MIIGPDLNAVRERAKTQVMAFFVEKAERDGTPATLRALYVMKAAQAELVLAGGSSALIEGEAEMRGWTPFQMATVIGEMAAESAELELARMRANVAIENAGTEQDILAILDMAGIKFRMKVDP